MGEDSGGIRHGGKDDECTYEGAEGGGGAHVDAAEDCLEEGAEEDGALRVVVCFGDVGEEGGEGHGVVARQGPEHAGGSDVAADTG